MQSLNRAALYLNGRILLRDTNIRPVDMMPCYNAAIVESVAVLMGLASRATAGFKHYVEDLPLETTPQIVTIVPLYWFKPWVVTVFQGVATQCLIVSWSHQ